MKLAHSLLVLTLLLPTTTLAQNQRSLQDRLDALSPIDRDEVLWLARCIYSESNLADEQRLVAWVVRNRVETQYRGTTYREVVLEPLQFSAFNTDTPRRAEVLALGRHSRDATFQQALGIALNIYLAPADDRPFQQETRHFYSPISMKNGLTPPWAMDVEPLALEDHDIDPRRFLFFAEIDASRDPYITGEDVQLNVGEKMAQRRTNMQARTGLSTRRLPFKSKVARPSTPKKGGIPGRDKMTWTIGTEKEQ